MASAGVRMVRGPAVVKVFGRCRVLGVDVSLRSIVVRTGKTMPFEMDADCELDVKGGDSWLSDAGNSGTRMWQEIAENILSKESGSSTKLVMVVGATDSGKSTFSTYLANLAIDRGIVPSIVDGDIGQGDLAPPSALGGAILKEQVTDLRDARPSLFEFVGKISPAGAERVVAQKLKLLVGKTMKISAKTSCMWIVNTDGYFDPLYKGMLAEAVSPDIVIYMNKDRLGIDALTSALLARWRLVVTPSSSSALMSKTPGERIGRRMEQYHKYVGKGHIRKRVGSVVLQYQDRPISWRSMLRLGPKGMFVALGWRRNIAGFGIIQWMDEQQVSIRSDLRDFSRIHASEVRLHDNREERIIFSSQIQDQ